VGSDAGSAGLPEGDCRCAWCGCDAVTLHVTLLGGGFGAAGARLRVEAALVSKACQGPVKVIWTREDDMQNSPYRPCRLA